MWEKIKGHSNYSVSDDGLVRNDKTCKILKPAKTYNGYLRIYINKKNYRVHRLVANAFIENPFNYPQVNHKDGNKENNKASNLEWCNAKQNINHAYNKGLKKIDYTNIENPKPIEQLNLEGKVIGHFNSLVEAEKKLGFNNSNISKACRGIQKTAYGYKWRYATL